MTRAYRPRMNDQHIGRMFANPEIMLEKTEEVIVKFLQTA